VIFRQGSDRSQDESLRQAISPSQITLTEKQKLGLPTILSLWLALLGSGVVTYYALKVLIEGGPRSATLLVTESFDSTLQIFALTVYVDRLAAFFLLLIGGLSIGISIYSFAYLREKADRALIAGSYNLFVLSGVLFVVANNVFFFILLLECVTLTFGALVLHRHYEQPSNSEHQRAVKTYLIANHIGGVFVLAALLILAISHRPVTFDMTVFRDVNRTIDSGTANLVFFLALIGFGIKAGIAPFHIWVSIAHPSSPTNTHAMSLGIMIKIALYGMIRVFFQFLHPIFWWWGLVVLIVAALTAVIGVRNALYGRTLKDSLADHSVENIGIILAGIGLALTLKAGNLPEATITSSVLNSLAALALVAGLYHLLNHTVFKGLLYLCTGAIDYLTNGVVELDKLGGLIHRFRWTSACFLVGSIAIAGFPPFNGFISEWLTLQTLIAGANILSQNVWLLGGIVLSLLLLASAFALTAFAFVKIAGEVFLGKPRDETVVEDSAKSDVPWAMRGVLIVLAILCLALGILPGPMIIILGTITSDLGLSLASTNAFSWWGGITISLGPQGHLYSDHLQSVFLFTLFGLVIFVFLIAALASKSRGTRAVWTGGTQYDPGIMQYTSGVFTFPVRDFLGRTLVSVLFTPLMQSLLKKRFSQLSTQQSGTLETPPIKTRFEVATDRSVAEPFRLAYNWLIKLFQSIARSTGSFFQNGDLRSYLFYIFLFFIAVFIILVGVSR